MRVVNVIPIPSPVNPANLVVTVCPPRWSTGPGGVVRRIGVVTRHRPRNHIGGDQRPDSGGLHQTPARTIQRELDLPIPCARTAQHHCPKYAGTMARLTKYAATKARLTGDDHVTTTSDRISERYATNSSAGTRPMLATIRSRASRTPSSPSLSRILFPDGNRSARFDRIIVASTFITAGPKIRYLQSIPPSPPHAPTFEPRANLFPIVTPYVSTYPVRSTINRESFLIPSTHGSTWQFTNTSHDRHVHCKHAWGTSSCYSRNLDEQFFRNWTATSQHASSTWVDGICASYPLNIGSHLAQMIHVLHKFYQPLCLTSLIPVQIN